MTVHMVHSSHFPAGCPWWLAGPRPAVGNMHSATGRRVQMGKYIARNRGKVVQVTIKGQQRAYKIETPHNSRAGMVYRLRQVS